MVGGTPGDLERFLPILSAFAVGCQACACLGALVRGHTLQTMRTGTVHCPYEFLPKQTKRPSAATTMVRDQCRCQDGVPSVVGHGDCALFLLVGRDLVQPGAHALVLLHLNLLQLGLGLHLGSKS